MLVRKVAGSRYEFSRLVKRSQSHFSPASLRSLRSHSSIRAFSSSSRQLTKQRLRFIGRLVSKIILVGLGTGILGVSYLVATDKGMYRAAYFWAKFGYVYAHYRINQYWIKDLSDEEKEKSWNQLHDRYCHGIFAAILHLRGFYIKIAQMASVRDDFIPKQYMDLLKTAQDKCPQEDGQVIRNRIIQSLKLKRLEDVFVEFNDSPVGSASIGQVHWAKLKDGREVAIKVMDPDAEQHFKGDMATLKSFVKLAQPIHLPLLEAIEKHFLGEFDYRTEAKHLDEIATNLSKVEGNYTWVKDNFVVPKPIFDYCTENVLVMTFLHGTKIISAIINRHREIAAQRGVTLEQLQTEGKKSPKNAAEMRRITSSLRTWDSIYNTGIFLYNWTFVPLLRLSVASYRKTVIPINIPEILDMLIKVHGYEIFMNGVFNGDPHPGNILLMPDEKLGLIDYGSCARLSKENRIKLAKLIVALAARNEKEVFRVYTQEMGFRTTRMDPAIINKYATINFDRDDMTVTEGMNVQLYLESLGKKDAILTMPGEFSMAHRAASLLKGFGYAFKISISVARVWAPIAQDFLKKEGIRYEA